MRNLKISLSEKIRMIEVFAILAFALVIYTQLQSSIKVAGEHLEKISQQSATYKNDLLLQGAFAFHQHTNRINRILIEKPELREFFEIDEKNPELVLSFMLLADYDLLFRLHEIKAIDQETWCSTVLKVISIGLSSDSLKKSINSAGAEFGKHPGFEKVLINRMKTDYSAERFLEDNLKQYDC